ncbi:RibD family protein [Actinospica robiniae]|uniref:RibD family protein n=1 Tax=Actinospica robiniae TaxID=304901 RepID=UPI0003FFE25F|nr:dihydrofolate reductase family protein [Actinospica robiniae]
MDAEPLVRLYEDPDLLREPLPAELARLYGGELGFTEPCLYANFVSSLDGVVALGPEFPSSGSTISGHAPADRFTMGLLRACAHAVLVGAGTLRASADHRWVPEYVYPAAADAFSALRRARRLPAQPELVVVTARGNLPTDHPALQSGALIATTAKGAAELRGRLPAGCTVVELGAGESVDFAALIQVLRERGHTTVLSEAGPHLLAQLIGASLLDELFLTVSPLLAGRDRIPREGLVAGLELLPKYREQAELISVRNQGSYLFLRYRFRGRPVETA